MNTIMPLGIMLVNQIHNCDKEEFLFQNWEFLVPGSGVLVLGRALMII